MMTWRGVQARMDRLCELATGLGRERSAVFDNPGVLTTEEKLAYMQALKEADHALMGVASVLYGAKLRKDFADEQRAKSGDRPERGI
jgi:hypothetical protein